MSDQVITVRCGIFLVLQRAKPLCTRRDWENSKPLGIAYAVDVIHALLGEAQNREQMLHDYVMSVRYH